jgi:hypothetical protein
LFSQKKVEEDQDNGARVIPKKVRDADQINNNIETLKERRLLALRNYIAEEIPKM